MKKTQLTDKHVTFFSVTPSRKFMRLFERAEIQNVLISYHYIKEDPEFTNEVMDRVQNWGGLFMTDSGAFSMFNDKAFNPMKFDWDSYVVEYTNWLRNNKGRIFIACNLDVDIYVGHEKVKFWNTKYFKPLEEFMQIAYVAHKKVQGIEGMAMVKEYCKEHDFVSVSEEFAKEASGIYQLARQTKTSIHGLAWTKPTILREYPFFSVDSTSWVGYQKFGSTPVWDGVNFTQYDKDNKGIRKTLKNKCDKYGVKFEEFCSEKNPDGSHNDDEGLTYSLCTWRDVMGNIGAKAQVKLAATVGSLLKNKSTKFKAMEEEAPKKPSRAMDALLAKSGVDAIVTDTPDKDKIDYAQGDNGEVAVYQKREEALTDITQFSEEMSGGMFCNSCFVQDKCPKFRASSTCAFNFSPAAITKDPLTTIDFLIKIQMERVNRAMLMEKLEGGLPNKLYSGEFSLLERLNSAKADLMIKAQGGGISFSKTVIEVRGGGQGHDAPEGGGVMAMFQELMKDKK